MTRKQIVAGTLLVLAGIAQIPPGLRPVDGARSWLMPGVSATSTGWFAGALWAVAMLGLLAAGFHLLGVLPWRVSWRVSWRPVSLVALAASALMLALYWPVYALLACLLDIAALVVVLRWHGPVAEGVPLGAVRTRWRRVGLQVARVVAPALMVYSGVAVLLRPWYIRWGSGEREERLRSPVTDGVTPEPSFQTTRVIVIQAPAREVWPWLVQLGQDRAGFYSYDWMERLAGLGVQNHGTVVPEWQHRAVGDLVRAAPADALGGALGPSFGFRVAAVEPGRLLAITSPILDWSFILDPIDDRTTRLIVRARGNATPGLKNYMLSLGDFYFIGPAHFIMEQKMLRTVRERAEATTHASAQGPSARD